MPLSACPGFPFLAALPEHPGLGDSVAFQFTGLLVVFTTLAMIWASTTLLGLFFKTRPVPRAAVAALPATPAAPKAEPIDPALVVAITAAVHATLRGAPCRIHAIVPVTGQDWAQEGRRQIFSSHQVR